MTEIITSAASPQAPRQRKSGVMTPGNPPRKRKRKIAKPAKPHPDFPLFPHATKRWAKKIRGEFHFFGPWRDPQGALEEWLRVKDELLAGRKPRPKNNEGAVTVELVVNSLLTHKERLRDHG